MRKAALLFVIAVLGYAASAQFTLRPQIGIEDPSTKISYNNLSSFAPVTQIQPQLGLHADYKFKSGFGPFIGLATSRNLVNYNFDDPETGMNSYHAAVGKIQMQLQAGLQYNSKPVTISKASSSQSCKLKMETSSSNRSCCSHSVSSCGKSRSSEKSAPKRDVWTVSFQPSAGLAYMPSSNPDLETKTSGTQNSYTYNAGNIKTAVVSGVAFEFSKNKTKFLTLSVNYFKGLGSDQTDFTAQSGSKTVNTSLHSTVSGWNAALGIPISFTKSTVSKTRKTHHGCGGEYRSKCGSYRKI